VLPVFLRLLDKRKKKGGPSHSLSSRARAGRTLTLWVCVPRRDHRLELRAQPEQGVRGPERPDRHLHRAAGQARQGAAILGVDSERERERERATSLSVPPSPLEPRLASPISGCRPPLSPRLSSERSHLAPQRHLDYTGSTSSRRSPPPTRLADYCAVTRRDLRLQRRMGPAIAEHDAATARSSLGAPAARPDILFRR
jgi:hypothetical protein